MSSPATTGSAVSDSTGNGPDAAAPSAPAVTWADLIDDYARMVASLEHRLDADAWQHDVDAFDPPSAPDAAPTAAELHRFAELHRRAERCNARIGEELAAIRSDVSQLDARRAAARKYGGQ